MRYLWIAILFGISLLWNLSSCHSHDHDTEGGHDHSQDDHGHAHAEEGAVLSFTERTGKTELFVEFEPMVVGKETRFAAHFTEMQNFKAIEEGQASVQIMQVITPIVTDSKESPASPGIFRLAFTPEKKGVFDLRFLLSTPSFSDTIEIKNVTVYGDEHAAAHAEIPEGSGDEISYLKEQAWKTTFAIEAVQKRPVRQVIRTSGEFKPLRSKEKSIVAKSNGIVTFSKQNLQEGMEVRNGELLFNISSKELVAYNLDQQYQTAAARLERARADFERAEKLIAQEVIGQKEFERRKMEFEVAQSEFKNLSKNYSQNGLAVRSPMSGIIKNVLVKEGQFVEEGTALMEITDTKKLLLQADVSQKYLPRLKSIQTAHFQTSYQKEMQKLEDYNGKLVSYGTVLEDGQNFIPLIFELDNVLHLVPGSFVDLYLLGNATEENLVIPAEAIMKDYGSKYVFVQTGGESFEKREIQTGIEDGIYVEILKGLSAGEWVVTKGAYQIKMASMSSAIPAHGHSH